MNAKELVLLRQDPDDVLEQIDPILRVGTDVFPVAHRELSLCWFRGSFFPDRVSAFFASRPFRLPIDGDTVAVNSDIHVVPPFPRV